MEGGVAAPAGMEEGPLLLAEGGIVGLEAEVKAQEEIVKVETEAGAVGGGKLPGD